MSIRENKRLNAPSVKKYTATDNRRVAKGIGLVAFFLFVGKLAAALKEMVFAYRFGTAEIVDVYLVVFTISMLFPMIWTVVLASVFVPYSKKLKEDDLNIFVSQMSGVSLILGGVFALLGIVLMPALVPFIWNDFSTDGQRSLIDMFRGLSPIVVAAFLSGQYAAQLLALEKHSNSLMDGLPSLGLALVLLLFPADSNTTSIVMGSLIGFFMQVIGLALLLRFAGALPSVTTSVSSPVWQGFRNAMGIMVLSQFIMSLTYPLDLYFAGDVGQGAIATFGYAQRLLILAMSLGATAIARAVLPVLSDVNKCTKEAIDLTHHWAILMGVFGFIAALIGFFLTPFIVRLLFERGAFTAEDTANVSSLIQFGLLQLPIYLSGMVFSQYLASQRMFIMIFYSSIIALAVKVIAGYGLTSLWGLNGLMLSSAVMYLVSVTYLFRCTLQTARISESR